MYIHNAMPSLPPYPGPGSGAEARGGLPEVQGRRHRDRRTVQVRPGRGGHSAQPISLALVY